MSSILWKYVNNTYHNVSSSLLLCSCAGREKSSCHLDIYRLLPRYETYYLQTLELHEAPCITRWYGRAVWFHRWVHTPKVLGSHWLMTLFIPIPLNWEMGTSNKHEDMAEKLTSCCSLSNILFLQGMCWKGPRNLRIPRPSVYFKADGDSPALKFIPSELECLFDRQMTCVCHPYKQKGFTLQSEM